MRSLACTIALAVSSLTSFGPPALAGHSELFSVDDTRAVARSSTLNGPNGVEVGPDGNLYVASVLGGEITVHDPRTGRVIDRIGPERGVDGPDDVAIGADGTLYWTEFFSGYVGLLGRDGSFHKQFVGQGVNPIALADDGRLFVARRPPGAGLYELDPELRDPPRLISGELDDLNGMDFGPDGLLYAPLFSSGEIVRVDVDVPAPEPETIASGLDMPAGVAFDAAGRLHGVDYFEGAIFRVDVATGAVHVIADVDGILDNLAFDAHDRLYATSSPDGQILRLTPGRTIRALDRAGLTRPEGIAVSPDGTVWVANLLSLNEYRTRQTPRARIYTRSFEPPGPAAVDTVAVDGDLLITTGWFTNSVQVMDPATLEIREDIRTLALPLNAIRHGDVLVAAQAGAGNVVDARTGDELLGDLGYPLGLASDGSTLYVSDRATGVVWAVSPSGAASRLASGLATPEGLAVDGRRLLVVEEGLDRVAAIDLATGALSSVVVGLDLGERVVPGTLPHGSFNGVAVGPNGAIYVTADGQNAAYRFPRR